MPDGRIARTRAYVPPTLNGEPYTRACGCRGEKHRSAAGIDHGIDHYACSAHKREADEWSASFHGQSRIAHVR